MSMKNNFNSSRLVLGLIFLVLGEILLANPSLNHFSFYLGMFYEFLTVVLIVIGIWLLIFSIPVISKNLKK